MNARVMEDPVRVAARARCRDMLLFEVGGSNRRWASLVNLSRARLSRLLPSANFQHRPDSPFPYASRAAHGPTSFNSALPTHPASPYRFTRLIRVATTCPRELSSSSLDLSFPPSSAFPFSTNIGDVDHHGHNRNDDFPACHQLS